MTSMLGIGDIDVLYDGDNTQYKKYVQHVSGMRNDGVAVDYYEFNFVNVLSDFKGSLGLLDDVLNLSVQNESNVNVSIFPKWGINKMGIAVIPRFASEKDSSQSKNKSVLFTTFKSELSDTVTKDMYDMVFESNITDIATPAILFNFTNLQSSSINTNQNTVNQTNVVFNIEENGQVDESSEDDTLVDEDGDGAIENEETNVETNEEKELKEAFNNGVDVISTSFAELKEFNGDHYIGFNNVITKLETGSNVAVITKAIESNSKALQSMINKFKCK